MALPQLTYEQRKAALEKAAAARHARAELREQIKKGEKGLALVDRELGNVRDPKRRELCREHVADIMSGRGNDFRF